MIINEQTRISALIKHNTAAVDAIASINSHFLKLKNPILRRLLAPRVTISDAAKIGNCTVKDFMDKLQPLGFVFEARNTPPAVIADIKSENHFSESALAAPQNTIVLDVRPVLESGKDPFGIIMEKIKQLQSDEELQIIAPFVPAPLINILGKKGYQHRVVHAADHVETFFFKPAEAENVPVDDQMYFELSQEAFNLRKTQLAGQMRSLDVRALEMPMPMAAINNVLSTMGKEEALFVVHRKIPVFLLQDLKVAGYTVFLTRLSENELHLIIFRTDTGNAELTDVPHCNPAKKESLNVLPQQQD